jgi:hypothetical protein
MHAYFAVRNFFRAYAGASFSHRIGYVLLSAVILIFSASSNGYAAEGPGIDSNAPLEQLMGKKRCIWRIARLVTRQMARVFPVLSHHWRNRT